MNTSTFEQRFHRQSVLRIFPNMKQYCFNQVFYFLKHEDFCFSKYRFSVLKRETNRYSIDELFSRRNAVMDVSHKVLKTFARRHRSRRALSCHGRRLDGDVGRRWRGHTHAWLCGLRQAHRSLLRLLRSFQPHSEWAVGSGSDDPTLQHLWLETWELPFLQGCALDHSSHMGWMTESLQWANSHWMQSNRLSWINIKHFSIHAYFIEPSCFTISYVHT